MENDEEVLRNLVVERLAAHKRVSDITQEVCERSGMYWSEAEAWVREIAVMHDSTIRKKRSPVLIALALATFLGGAGLLAATFFAASNVIAFYRSSQPEVLSTINILLLIANEAPTAIWLGSLGLAMLAGSLLGMRDVWADWLAH